MTQPAGPQTLLVPIELNALAVGVDGPKLADLAFDFAIAIDPALAWLGQNAQPKPFALAPAPGRGVHLHWRLPAALCRSQVAYGVDADVLERNRAVWGLQHQDEALSTALRAATAATRARLSEEIAQVLTDTGVPDEQAHHVATQLADSARSSQSFPAAPNRWLVCRWDGAAADGQPAKTWLVESDRLWSRPTPDAMVPGGACDEQNRLSPTVLHLPQDRSAITPAQPLHRCLGRVFPAQTWSEADQGGTPAERLAPFTALGYGHPMFAAALPHCYNVFGLWDPLDGVGADAVFSYAVVGWYATTADDPAPRAAEFGWVDTPPPRGALSTYRGALHKVNWQRDKTPWPVPHQISASLGLSTAEALSAAIVRQLAFQGQADLESYFNVLQLGLVDRLHERLPGALKEWDQALHRSEFSAVPAGTRWVLRPPGKAVDGAMSGAMGVSTGAAAQAAAGAPAPSAAQHRLLAHLNHRQSALDRSERTLQAQREQLFADWANHLAGKHVEPVSLADAATFDGRRNFARSRLSAGVADVARMKGDAVRAARKRDAARAAVQQDLAAAAPTAAAELQLAPGPRFWQPSDPVLLLWGEDLLPPVPFSSICRWIALDPDDVREVGWSEVPQAPAAGLPAPWRAVMLAWEVSYQEDHPLAHAQTYPARYLADRYTLGPDDPNDLSDLPPAPAGRVITVTGLVPLTDAPTTNLAAQCQRFLARYPAAADDAAQQQIEADLRKTLADLARAPIQSQALSGFNDALLGRRQSLEFPLLDPHAANASEFRFGLEVAAAVATGNSRGCVPDVFNPLRAGRLQVQRLWLIDAFGRPLEVLRPTGADADSIRLAPTQVSVSQRQAACPVADGRCSLRPRLLPPARLNFRWRAAVDSRVDSDHDPTTSPIVGWLIPEHLDSCLAFYRADGSAVGTLNVDGLLWRGAPGPGFDLPPEGLLPEGPLRQMIEGLMAVIDASGTRAPLQAIMGAIDDLTQHILPSQHEQHPGLALLIGRPLAIVSATVDLELAAQPPLDQRAASFFTPLHGPSRSDGGLAGLLVPVKLGHRAHLDDGLVGYFVGPSAAPATWAAFYVEQFDDAQPAAPVFHPARDQVAVSVAGEPVQLTLLIDPRSPIHATTGILPVKSIDLPAALYATTLSRLAVSFPVGPLLGPRDPVGAMPLPTPEEPGYEWQFVYRAGPDWVTRVVDPVAPAAAGLGVTHDLYEGWLLLSPPTAKDAPDAA